MLSCFCEYSNNAAHYSRNSIPSMMTHSRSLSDNSGSSSSQGSHVVSPGRYVTPPGPPTSRNNTIFSNKRGLPRFATGQRSIETEQRAMKQVDASPPYQHSPRQVFAVPEEKRQTLSAVDTSMGTATTEHSNNLYCSSNTTQSAAAVSTPATTYPGRAASLPLATSQDTRFWMRTSGQLPDVLRRK